jgi:SAM-dependent methyltransferase
MNVSYELVEDFPGWSKAPDFFKSLLAEHGCRHILEVGSGANPTLAPEFVQSNGLFYVTSDQSPEELEKANAVFERLVLDLSAKEVSPDLIENFDCILSRMVGEHISDGRQYHKNIFRMLRPGGISVHCFSTLWCLPFAVNRLIPESLGEMLLNAVSPRDNYQHGKFKAYYSWSRGPSRQMVQGFEELGFEVVRYTGYFGHFYYRPKFSWLHQMEMLKSRLLLKHPVPQLCSYATLVLRKPQKAAMLRDTSAHNANTLIETLEGHS